MANASKVTVSWSEVNILITLPAMIPPVRLWVKCRQVIPALGDNPLEMGGSAVKFNWAE
jgi:hypothetical protein